jgi:hypothetical protein
MQKAYEIEETYVNALSELALDEKNAVSLLSKPGILGLAVAAAKDGETEGIKSAGLHFLLNLSRPVENALALFLTPHVADVALAAASSSERKLTGLGLLHNLSADARTRVALCATPRLLDVATQAVEEFEPCGLMLLQNLSTDTENRLPLFSHPKLIAAVLENLDPGKSDDNNIAGLKILQNFAADYNFTTSLLQRPGALERGIRCTEWQTTSVAAFGLLHGFSRCGASRMVLDTRDVLVALMGGLQRKDCVCLAALTLANILGCDSVRSVIFTHESLLSIISFLSAGLEDELMLSNALRAINSLTQVESHRLFFVKNGLIPLLVRGLAAAIKFDHVPATGNAVYSLRRFSAEEYVHFETRAKEELYAIIEKIAALKDAKWETVKHDARCLDYAIHREGKYSSVPKTPEEVEIWLEFMGLKHVYTDFVREGLVSGERPGLLAKKSAADLAILLKIRGGDALEVEKAIKRTKWGRGE